MVLEAFAPEWMALGTGLPGSLVWETLSDAPVSALAANGPWVVSGGWDGMVRLWRVLPSDQPGPR